VRHEGPFKYVHEGKAKSRPADAHASCRIVLFAVIMCRKFATVAAFSWHLPHPKNAAAINPG
jgi:hypothetical protein